MAAMTLKGEDEIKKQNFIVTAKAIKEFFDRDFLDLFMQSVQSAQKD